MNLIGIRCEDKNKWERRVPLVPEDVKGLEGVKFVVMPCSNRCFGDSEYEEAGAVMDKELKECDAVIGVKEMGIDFFEEGKTYMFFSHTIKGQKDNMEMLKRLVEKKCTLIDYECISEEGGRRLVAFGKFAGIAGMIDSLCAYGKRLEAEGKQNVFSKVKMAHEYESLEEAKREIGSIEYDGSQGTIVCGFTGYGNVSKGAQEIFDLLTPITISPRRLLEGDLEEGRIYKVVFKEEDMVRAIEGEFDLGDYYKHGREKYEGNFERFLPHLTILMNGIYWTDKYPRLLTIDTARRLWDEGSLSGLKVIGDVTCDVEGSIELNAGSTTPSDPVYVYDLDKCLAVNGYRGEGPVVLAVDNLPAELPRESSEYFSSCLRRFVLELARGNLEGSFSESGFSDELKRAVILWHGEFTDKFKYMEGFLEG